MAVGLEPPLEPRVLLDGRPLDLMISEFLAANSTGLRDQDGDSSDWIEVFNPTTHPVDLKGWSLTDDRITGKWHFPDETIDPSQFLVVYASGKNRATAGAELHTNFKIAAGGGYLGLVRPDGTVADDYGVSYPSQYRDISFGHPFNTTQLVAPGATASVRIPDDGSLGSSWTGIGFATDGSWISGPTGLGFGVVQAGFTSGT